MPEIGTLHPIIVHFVVALGVFGVLFRLVSLTGKLSWTGPAATALILCAAVAAVVAAQSGHDAHGLAERIPGVREAVQEHEESGEWTRNLFVVLGIVELAALALRSKAGLARGLTVVSAVLGLVTFASLIKTGDYGGDLVYSYAGGVGTRTGDSTDVRRLLIAGLYHQARIARVAGQLEEAARLTDELVKQSPTDPSVKLLAAESMLKDRKDPAGALAALNAIQVAPEDRLNIRKGMLASDAWVAAGQKDSAKAVLTDLAQRFPQAGFVAEALKKLE
jgi:uncharacterized membrane protein